jgi:hypothetical protein
LIRQKTTVSFSTGSVIEKKSAIISKYAPSFFSCEQQDNSKKWHVQKTQNITTKPQFSFHTFAINKAANKDRIDVPSLYNQYLM